MKNDKVTLVSPCWKEKHSTNLIRWLMVQADMKPAVLAEYLGITPGYLNNRFQRNSFGIHDVIIAAYATGFKLMLVNKDTKRAYEIDYRDYLTDAQLKRLERAEVMKKEALYQEYLTYKQLAKQMEETYGFKEEV